jgi:uncharacterized protein YbjQ (UPF0145 family)
VTLDALPGREIAGIVGDVVGVVARGRDLPPELRGGGLEAGYVSMLTRSRQDAVARAVEMAESAGADAILGLRFDCSEITQNMSEVVAYGTAVTLVPLPDTDADTGTDTRADVEADAAGSSNRQPTPASAASGSEPTVATPRSEWGPPQQPQQGQGSSGTWPPPSTGTPGPGA